MISSSPRTWRPLVALLLGFVALQGLVVPAGAAEDPADERPAISLRLSPAVLEVPYEPGPTQHELRVDNTGSQTLQVVPQLSEFTVTAEGTTQFTGPDEVAATSWVTLDTDGFELAPGERRDVTVTVDVPTDAEPGERYVSVIFTVPPAGGEGNIEVTHRVAVKLYIAVPGVRTERIELGDLTGPPLIDNGPAAFELTVHNRGNVHRRFEEDGRLTASSGGDQFPFENFTVLGNSTRVVEAVWPDPPLVCWCTVEVQVDDGQGQTLTASTRVISFPVRLSLAIVALTGGLAALAVARRRRRAARLQHQLEQARREGAATSSATTVSAVAGERPSAGPAELRTDQAGRTDQPTTEDAKPASVDRGSSQAPDQPSERTDRTTPVDTNLFTAQGSGKTSARRRRR